MRKADLLWSIVTLRVTYGLAKPVAHGGEVQGKIGAGRLRGARPCPAIVTLRVTYGLRATASNLHSHFGTMGFL